MAEAIGPVENDGLALMSYGFVGEILAVNDGIGLMTSGFLWSTSSIWEDCSACADDATTVWMEVNR